MDCIEHTKDFYKAELENCKRLYKQMSESLDAARKQNIKLCERIGDYHKEITGLKQQLKVAECPHSYDASGVCEICGHGSYN